MAKLVFAVISGFLEVCAHQAILCQIDQDRRRLGRERFRSWEDVGGVACHDLGVRGHRLGRLS